MNQAFASDTELAKAVEAIVTRYPDTLPVFQRVVKHFQETQDHERPGKRIKLEETEHASNGDRHPSRQSPSMGIKRDNDDSEIILTVKDLSFVTPLRKKLTLSLTEHSLMAAQPDSPLGQIEVQYSQISDIIVLPVPEKAAKQYNFCIFQRDSDEAVVFTVPDARPTTAAGPGLTSSYAATYKALLMQTLYPFHEQYGFRLTEPNTQDFTSALPQQHRKHEPAVHIIAHRGSKEGYLFFLPQGLVFGFKRPVLLMPMPDIVSITYNDVLQRTFNLTVTIKTNEHESGGAEELEFGLIDAAEYDAVDKFVKKFKLNDASLSESRRAVESKTSKTNGERESEISKAADAIANSVTGIEAGSEDEDDEDFSDDESHSGSTIASDESDVEDGPGSDNDHDVKDQVINLDEESDGEDEEE